MWVFKCNIKIEHKYPFMTFSSLMFVTSRYHSQRTYIFGDLYESTSAILGETNSPLAWITQSSNKILFHITVSLRWVFIVVVVPCNIWKELSSSYVIVFSVSRKKNILLSLSCDSFTILLSGFCRISFFFELWEARIGIPIVTYSLNLDYSVPNIVMD